VNAVLSVMEGSQLLYSIQPHPALTPIMHLLPPNILVSGPDRIPGVVFSTDTGTGRLTHNAPSLFIIGNEIKRKGINVLDVHCSCKTIKWHLMTAHL